MQSDEQLALGLQRGQRDNLAPLVQRHHSPLLGYLYRLSGGNRALAEDLVQETFLRVLQAIGQYHYPRPFKAWLYAIATNLARDHFKRAEQRRTISAPGDDIWENLPAGSASPEREVSDNYELQQIVAQLRALPAHQREAVILRYSQGMPLAEIAAMLDVPVGTVKSRLSLGLRRLRSLLVKE